MQDYPGRVGYWDVGVPPSGPMDDLSFRRGNALLGNDEGAAGLEFLLAGPDACASTRDASSACRGAPMRGRRSTGEPVPQWEPIDRARPAASSSIGEVAAVGCACYLLVAGGFDVPVYLGSRPTFLLGGFGGHGGRALRDRRRAARSARPADR